MKWIYKYIRADGEEIDMGFFATEGEAKKASKEHALFGALTTEPICVHDDYKIYKGGSVEEEKVGVCERPQCDCFPCEKEAICVVERLQSGKNHYCKNCLIQSIESQDITSNPMLKIEFILSQQIISELNGGSVMSFTDGKQRTPPDDEE